MHVVTDRATLGGLADAVEQAKDMDYYDPATGRPWPTYVSTVRESAQGAA